MTEPVDNNQNTSIENVGRRKAVKNIIGGVTVIAAYNLMPVKWGEPYVESVFLPAHAATSGSSVTCTESAILGAWSMRGTGSPNYPEVTCTVASGGVATNVVNGAGNALADGTWALSGSVITFVFTWVDGSDSGVDTYVLTLTDDCSSHSGTGTVTINMNGGAYTETQGAVAPSA